MRAPHNPVRAARRNAELRARFGSEHPRCIYCGCAELPLLMRIKRVLLEKHHPDGVSHDPTLIVLTCRNCHAKFHENALDAGVNYEPEADPVLRVASGLRSEAVHFEMLADNKRRQAAELEESRK